MTDPITVKLIFAEDVPENPVLCPRCKGGNITLMGHLKRVYDEVQENGQAISTKMGEELFQEVDHIECRNCNIRFTITSKRLAELEELTTSLESIITGQGGQC